MNRSELRGWKKVFDFTFIQHYRSKSAVIGLIVTCLLIILSGPVLGLAFGSGFAEKMASFGECKIENFYLKNDTDVDFDTKGFAEKYTGYGKINFIRTDESSEAVQAKLDENSLRDVFLWLNVKDEKYYFSFFKSKDSEIGTLELSTLGDSMRDYFFDLRIKHAGISEESAKLINADRSVDVVEFSKISGDEKEGFNPVLMMAETMYACVVMMIVMVSSQQIAVSLVTEKSSKVIETLLLSVRPLAIVTGKIFGTMAVLLCNAVVFIICGGISSVLTSVIASQKYSDVMLSALTKISEEDMSAEFDMAAAAEFSISPFRIIFGIAAVIITTVIAFLFYSVFAGITGASCKSMEDLGSANAFISLSTVLGVYLVLGAAMLNNPVLTKAAYFFPFSGIFMVPVEFIFGKASVIDLLILWAEISILTVLLFRFTAKIYHVLVYHNGERLKLKNLIQISKSQKGGV